jgi:hypothetical protein
MPSLAYPRKRYPLVFGFWYFFGFWFLFLLKTNNRWSGSLFSSAIEMDVKYATGPLAGKFSYGRYELDNGPATFFLTWAIAAPGASQPPVSWQSSMSDGSSVFVLVRSHFLN